MAMRHTLDTHVSWNNNRNHLPGVPIQGKAVDQSGDYRRFKYQA